MTTGIEVVNECPSDVLKLTVVSKPLVVGTQTPPLACVCCTSQSTTGTETKRGWNAHCPTVTDPAGLTPVRVLPLTPV